MKIKLDFITNSSSTSYIVFIPKDFVIKRSHITSTMELYEIADLLEETDNNWDKILCALNESLVNLKSTGTLWADHEESELSSSSLFNIIATIVQDQGFQLDLYASDAHDGKIHDIGKFSDRIISLLTAETLTQITVKGVDDVATKDQ